jgi:gliding motility-associated-like protein
MTTLLLIKLIFRKKYSIQIAGNWKHLFLVLIAMLVSFSATPQVTADFTTITSTTGCGSLVVEFKSLSLGSPTSWLWDFGNGNTSTLEDPIAIYNTAGNYNVVLKVSDGVTTDIKVAASYIKVHAEPTAALQAVSVVNGCMPLNTSFEDLSNTNTSIVSWQWDFGDGGSSNIQNPDYTYVADGLYSVSLSVVDVNGCQNLISEIDLVKIDKMPIADFTADITFSCNSSELVSFSNNSVFASTFLWDFGDGTISSLQNPVHVFSPGVYTVALSAKEGSCMHNLAITALIEVVESLSPDFTVNTNSGCEGLNVNFSDVTNNNPNTFLWEFGDGAISTLQNPIHIFDSVGIYDITLTTSISGQCATSVIFPAEIEVFAKPVVSFVSNTILGCSIPFSVAFTDNTIDVVSWSWDFGDGNFSNIQNPSNIYTTSGVFDVSLSVVSNDGCISSIAFPNYMSVDESPIVNFNAFPIVSCTGENINFSDFSSLATNNWKWNFGDGSSSNTQSPTHQYLLNGVYDVSLIAGINSCKDTLVFNNYIKIIEPTAIFEEVYNCNNPLKVEFENLSIGADNVFWDFGDGTTSNLLNPIHTFLNLGIHNISLSVNNNLTGCNHVFSKEIKLTQPIAEFDYLINASNSYLDSVGCTPKRVYLDNQSQDWSFYRVLWSDGYIGHSRIDHLLTDAGMFDVTMIVVDIHGCKDTAIIEDMYHMLDVAIDFGVLDISGCDSMLVEFEDFSNHPFAWVKWDFGDGGNSTINNPQHIYYNEGFYDVTLYTQSIYGCRDTLKRLEYIKFQHPTANFTSSDEDICVGEQVQFSNLSLGIGISSVWDFGDGISSNLLHPNHEFIANGLYNINLIVMDSFGCSNNLSLDNHIKVLSPIANFSALGLASNCPPLISDFTNLSSSDASFFEWNFGDGNISSVENPSHLFLNSGLFDVSLIVENSFGCKDTLLQNSFVDMSGLIPVGSFIVSDTLICKDDIVSFVPTVVNTDNFFWDFGNGVISNDSIATAIYSNTGIFMPTLIIENSSGCQLTVNSDDTIKVNEVIVDAGIDVEICEGESVQLNAVGNGSIVNWTPANALSSANTNSPQANPTASVLYYINHTDGLCTAVDSVFVYVHNDVPNATFTAANFCDGDLTSFVANSGLTTANNSYMWNFGQNGQLVNAVLNIGNNNVALIIENLNNSCKDTLEQNITIFPKPVADFLLSDTEVCLGDSVSFIDNSSSVTPIWFYNFGDSIGVSLSQNPSYTYMSPGVFNVAFNITSDMGCEDNIVKTVIIHELPIVDFAIENHCEGDGNIFINLSSALNSGIALVEYDFNDGGISIDSMVAHIFNGYGLFEVSLTATSNKGCSNSKIKTAEVFPNPIVNFVASQFCGGDPTIFNNLSFVKNADIISYNWIFGLEGSSVVKNTMHTFSSSGVFDVSLLVASDRGCKSMLSKKISIHKSPSVNFKVLSDICLGDESKIFYLSSVNNANVIEWNYNFGDGNYSAEQNPMHIYKHPAVFDVSLEVISSEGCRNDTIIPAIIEVHSSPIADFQVSSLFESELSPEINFFNNSEGAIFFEWNFDNGDYLFEESPTYSFSEPQIYNVVLTATNSFGCSSEMIKPIQINPEHTFFVPDAFTPDGDGLNDMFASQGKRISSFEMQVFDRWGGVVFESASINLGWDGNNSSGEQLSEGIYLYCIALYDINERLWVYNGELKLMREF